VTSRRGFTLLEVIVATTIMAVAVVTLLAGISGSTRVASRLRDYDRLVQLARLQMNGLLVEDRLPRNSILEGRFDPADTGGTQAGWQARVSRSEAPPNPVAGQFALDRIELEVWWMSGEARRSFTLDSYRKRLLMPQDIAAGGL
jgi:general secretion pathway protein I